MMYVLFSFGISVAGPDMKIISTNNIARGMVRGGRKIRFRPPKVRFPPPCPETLFFLFLKHRIEPIVFPGSPALPRTRTT
jgi:hypothetical protein